MKKTNYILTVISKDKKVQSHYCESLKEVSELVTDYMFVAKEIDVENVIITDFEKLEE